MTSGLCITAQCHTHLYYSAGSELCAGSGALHVLLQNTRTFVPARTHRNTPGKAPCNKRGQARCQATRAQRTERLNLAVERVKLKAQLSWLG